MLEEACSCFPVIPFPISQAPSPLQHHPIVSLSLSSLCVGGSGMLSPAGRRGGMKRTYIRRQKKTRASYHIPYKLTTGIKSKFQNVTYLEVQCGEESLADPEAGQLTDRNPLSVQPGSCLVRHNQWEPGNLRSVSTLIISANWSRG
jgi:hypothetical protein